MCIWSQVWSIMVYEVVSSLPGLLFQALCSSPYFCHKKDHIPVPTLQKYEEQVTVSGVYSSMLW